MNEFDKFKKKMEKVGSIFYKGESGRTSFFTYHKYIEIQVTSTKEQHETGLIAVSVALRKPGFYFPLGDCWALNNCNLIEKIEAILNEYSINTSLVINAMW
jgi:hypothetical protein